MLNCADIKIAVVVITYTIAPINLHSSPKLIEHGFTSAPTQYKLYGRRFLQVWWPNQQCQNRPLKSSGLHLCTQRKQRLPI